MNIAKSSAKIFVSRIIKSFAGFGAVIIFSRELGASPLGTYYPFIAVLSILAIPADFGIRGATEKRISEGSDPQSYLGTALALKGLTLLAIILLMIAFRSFFEQYLGADLVFTLVIGLMIQESARFSLTVLRGELRVGETAIVEILRPIGWLLVGYVLLTQGFGVRGLIYGYLTGVLAMAIVGWWKVSIRPAFPTLKHAHSLIDYGKWSMISAVGGYFYSWMDVAILTAFVAAGIAETRVGIGAYENAWRVSLLAMLVSQAIATTLFPQFSRWDAEDAHKRIESIIPTAILPALLIAIPAFAGTVVLSEDILEILFSTEFTVASVALVILMGEKIFQAIHVVFGRSLQAIDRPDLAAYATIVAVVVNLVLNIVLIWRFGIAGAALATAFSFVVNTGLHAYYLNQFITINFPIQEALWSIVASTVMGVVIYLVRSVVELSSIIDLVAIVSFGGIIYAVITLAYSPIRSQIWIYVGPVITKRIP